MAVASVFWVLLLSTILCLSASAKEGRMLVVVKDDSGNMFVDQITRDTLTSSLTTAFLPAIYIIVFVVGLPLNAMAIWVLLFRSKVHPAAIYMGNLAIADLMFVILTPLKIAYHLKGNNWTYGEEMCKVLIGFFYGNMYCSILFITCMSVQRYWVGTRPFTMQRMDNTVAIVVSVCIWIFIGVSTTPLYLYKQTVFLSDLNITTCHDVNVITKMNFDAGKAFLDVQEPYYYFMVMAVLVFFIPMVVIIVASVLLLRSLGESPFKGGAGKRTKRAVVLIVLVLVTFLVCFIPSNVMLVVHYSLLRNNSFNSSYGFYITSLCLASLNSCLDPFIYYYVSEDFREKVKNTLLCRSNRTVEQMRVSFNSMKYSKKTNTYTSGTTNTESSTC